jgi:hypothetical protein
MKSKEEKISQIRQAAAELRAKASQMGRGEPFISWAIDPKGGLLVLDVPGPVDTSSARALNWESDRFFVFVFSEARRSFFQTVIRC